ncbi:hypothetical protein GJ744_003649 [Endocarpon pusillum]|uniref:Mis12 domain-containing protein n=1 Tax=Endocarpon pusillum TaxID=364733 RepID=A0A8H7A9F0_9EURO|nr:hypothetical protein GJ744_003649 [Endocarpon pusillum]
MGDASQAATALLTEHLQYTPLSLIDDIINSVNNIVYQGISSLENGLTATPPARLGFKPSKCPTSPPSGDGDASVDYPEAKQEIEEGLHQLETLLESTVDKNFDKFEIYVLRNILSVPEELPSWIRLSHYENLSYPPPDGAPTQESVHLLRRKVIESQRLRNYLLTEASRNEAVIAQLKGLLTQSNGDAVQPSQSSQHDFSFLTSTPSAKVLNVSASSAAQQPITTNTKFALSQLPALRALLADLRPRLASLQAPRTVIDGARAERREERREYIEQRAKMHLQRHADSSSANNFPAAGKRVEVEEVEALEKVADIFDTH